MTWSDLELGISLDQAKHMIVTALHEFDSGLGERAKDVLNNPDRLRIVEAPYAITGMMQYRPAELTMEDVRSSGMYMEDFAERFGPEFTEQHNPRAYGIIDYEYTHTKESVLYLAHELGHAIADDVQREHGRSRKEFSQNQQEGQAYFVQSIVAAALQPEFNNESAAYCDVLCARDEFNRQSQRFSALTAYEQARRLPTEQRGAFITQTLGGLASEPSQQTALTSAAHVACQSVPTS